jgi:hypothetical protein
MVSLWWFAGTSDPISVSLYTNAVTPVYLTANAPANPTGTAGDITGSSYPSVYCSSSMATNYDSMYTNAVTNIQVQFSSTSSSWGLR